MKMPFDRSIGASALIVLCAVANFTCRGNATEPGKTPEGLQVIAESASTFSGGRIQFRAVVSFADGGSEDVTDEGAWSVRPGRAAGIEKGGLLQAFGDATGIETVMCVFAGETATQQVRIQPAAALFSISPTVPRVESGRKLQFDAFVTWQGGEEAFVKDEVNWSVSPGTSATIDANGLLTAASGGAGMEKVVATFQGHQAESEVEILPTYAPRFEMTRVPAGVFAMGSESGFDDQKPAHDVYTDEFLLGRYEITNAQYAAYLNDAFRRDMIAYEDGFIYPLKPPHRLVTLTKITRVANDLKDTIVFLDGDFQAVPEYADEPVVRMTWYGAKVFCQFYGLRLPTEAEWEKAARGGQQLEYGTADGTLTHDLANYVATGGADVYAGLAPVGMFPPNPFGLYDMCGNAAEAVNDVYDPQYYSASPTDNPTGPGPPQLLFIAPHLTTFNIWRGGCWFCESETLRSSYRGAKGIHTNDVGLGPLENLNMGIRVARSLPL